MIGGPPGREAARLSVTYKFPGYGLVIIRWEDIIHRDWSCRVRLTLDFPYAALWALFTGCCCCSDRCSGHLSLLLDWIRVFSAFNRPDCYRSGVLPR